jgi:putative glutamine amidotransferase
MPVIAVTPCRAMVDYLESVRRAGGDPLELRLDASPSEALARADAVLLTGGGDVDPSLYGESPHASYDAAEPGRDKLEIALVKAAFEADVPLLGICRGMQVINVALGGTLLQHIPSMVNGALQHWVPEPRYAIAHEVWMTQSSQLWSLMREALEGDDTCLVNSRHHQAVKTAAPGWDVTATAPDGVIEAIEYPGRPFCLAVQWHPENFWRTGEFRPLFEAFVAAAAAHVKK